MDRLCGSSRILFKRGIPKDDIQIPWNPVHVVIICHYLDYLSTACDLSEQQLRFKDICWLRAGLTMWAEIPVSLVKQIRHLFMVPRLDESQTRIRVKEYQLVKGFISFLLRLLSDKTDMNFGSCENQICNLEKELRFLLTLFGDSSLMLCANEHEEFQDLLLEFKAVANVAGSFVHSSLFPLDPACRKMKRRVGVVLRRIERLKANIRRFLNLQSSISRSAYHTAPRSSPLDSLLIVNSLVNDLEDLLNEEDDLSVDVRDQVERLHQGLTVLQSSVEDFGRTRPLEIEEMKQVLMRIGDMAHEAEYIVVSFLAGDAPLYYLVNRLTDVNHKTELIQTELKEVIKKYNSGGILKASKHVLRQRSLQAKRSLEVDDVIVGFEDRETHILDLLVGGAAERLQVISICGMPGLGKTTLAKKLYNHPSVTNWFDKISWCVVSQQYERRSVMADILTNIASERLDDIFKMEEEKLVELIHKTLKGRRYVIVMDDIWDPNVWYELLRCFPDDGNGSRILFTTRNNEVAPPNSIIYGLPSLSDDQCWKLLEKKVFVNESCPLELVKIGKQIAEGCRGLPLAVVAIAGVLSTTNREPSTWEEVRRHLVSFMIDGGNNLVMQILGLSFKHLPTRLKPCFLYCGIFFLERREIPVRELTRIWIAQGLVRKEKEKNVEDLAEGYLMELIDKSLVMASKRRSDGRIKACVVHDLLCEFCLKISKEEKFLWKISSKDNESGCLGPLQGPLNLSYFYYINPSNFGGDMLSFHGCEPRLLRMYNFHSSAVFHTGIENMACLRFVVAVELPPSISSFANLEYLRVESKFRRQPVYLISAVMKMKKLRYIHIPHKARYGEECDSSQTNNLEFLSTLSIRKDKDIEMLKCSPHLRRLKCSYEIMIYGHFDLRFLTQLESLNVAFCKGSPQIQEISLPASIRKLTISFRVWLSWEAMSMIGSLKNLEVLKLRRIFFGGETWDTRDGEFQKLGHLELTEIFGFAEWNVESSEHFPALQRLVLNRCKDLEEIPRTIGEIATLQSIEVKNKSRRSLVESAEMIKQEQWDMGNEELRLIIDHW